MAISGKNSSFYADGQWNFYCDLCGKKVKSSDSMKTWDGFRVCREHKEVRNPQDYLKGVKENQAVPWSRPEAPNQFVVLQCTLQTTNAIPSWAVPGCAYPSYVNLSWMGSLPDPGLFCTREGESSLPGWASPGCCIPSYNPFSIEGEGPFGDYA